MTADRRVWFITGAGRGLGRAFVERALAEGDLVIGTVRDPDALADLATAHPQALSVLPLDVTDRARAIATVDAAQAIHGRLDVVVNNAGYGIVGAAEELSEAEVRTHLDTNLLGALWVTQGALPHLRTQGSGHLVQISTVGGVGSMPTLGLYNAGKWALEGFSEALAAEVTPLGIRVTIAELGGFDTDWGGASMRFATPLPAYDDLRTSLFGTPTVPWELPEQIPAGNEPTPETDPSVAAEALMAHVRAEDGPLRLLIGDDAPVQVAAALEQRRVDYAHDPRFTWPVQESPPAQETSARTHVR